MYYMIAKYRVEDFNRFKKVFEEDPADRKSHGITGVTLIQGTKNPNNFSLLIELKDEKSLDEFYKVYHSDMMKEAFKKAGTIGGMPEVEIYNNVQKLNA